MINFPISFLFVPANRPEFFKKAEISKAQSIIFDLEDSVPKEEKNISRKRLSEFLIDRVKGKEAVIRINSLDTEEGKEDLETFNSLPKGIFSLIIPKLEEVNNLQKIPSKLKLILLIETPHAVKKIDTLASDPRVIGLALGQADLSTSLGSDMSWDSLLFSRSKIILECAINNLFSIDGPCMDVSSEKKLLEECRLSRSLGFNSKMAIHPSQIDVINKNFSPSEEEIGEAKSILKAFSESKEGVILFEGKIIDIPIVKTMERRLKLAGLKLDY